MNVDVTEEQYICLQNTLLPCNYSVQKLFFCNHAEKEKYHREGGWAVSAFLLCILNFNRKMWKQNYIIAKLLFSVITNNYGYKYSNKDQICYSRNGRTGKYRLWSPNVLGTLIYFTEFFTFIFKFKIW